MRLRLILPLTYIACGVWAHAAHADEPAAFKLADLAPNTWVAVSPSSMPLQTWSDVFYLPATDEFAIWGRPEGAPSGTRPYELSALSLRQPAPQWADCLPIGKEKS